MITELTPEIDWIHECHDVGDRHVHSAAYVIDTGSEHLLVDTGDLHYQDEIVTQIRDSTGGSGIDAAFVSKSHLPHSGNVRRIFDEWPEADLIFPGGIPEIHGFPPVEQWGHHDTRERDGRTFSTTRGPFIDIDHTTWLYDHASATLFSVDGFCFYHSPTTCSAVSRDLEGFAVDDVESFYRDILLWLQYSDPERVISRTRDHLAEFEIEWIAPGHGNPIDGDDLPAYLDTLETAIERIAIGSAENAE